MSTPTTPKAPRATPRKTASPAAKTRTARKTATAPARDASGVADPAPALELPASPALPGESTREALIRQRAYEHYLRNGCVAGREVEDWLAAEAEVAALMTEGSKSTAKRRK
jgi:hypothetical protein